MLELNRDMIGLDAATGAGFTAVKLAQKISKVYALDMVDENFIKEFNRKIAIENEINVHREDIFFQSNIENILNNMGRKTILFGGFFTDTDVFISSVSASIREYRSLVVSDISSTYSERLYFQSLEMISQFIDIIDTRDLGEDFPV